MREVGGPALATGALLALAFPPVNAAPLAYLALVPTGLALDRATPGARGGLARALRLGYATGFVFFLAGLHWIAFLSKVAVTVPWIMYPAWVAAALYLAIFPALAAAAAHVSRTRLGLPTAVGWPLFWLGAEWLRGQGELGFPWLDLGYTQWNVLPVLQLAALSGVTAVGAYLALVNGLVLAAALARRQAPRLGRRSLAFQIAAMAVVILPFLVLGPRIPAADPGRGPLVALVQGNVPGAVKWSGHHEDAILGKFLVLSRPAVGRGARLVVWPETATGSYLLRVLPLRLRLQSFVDSTATPILTGLPDYRFTGPETYVTENSAAVFWPLTGPGPAYAKMHLVPFGERMPFETVFPALAKIDFGQAEWLAGRDPRPLDTPVGPVGVLICFESIFSEPARSEVRLGARWLVVVTNDEWFGRTGALWQHAAMSVFRAVEHRVPLLRCANTGLTLAVDPWGRVREEVPVFEDRVLLSHLPDPGAPTFFTRHGDVAGTALAWLCGLVAVFALVRPRTEGRPR